MSDDEEVPERWWISPYLRALHDFEWIAKEEAAYFRSEETIKGLNDERKRVTKDLNLAMAVSFLVAAIMVLGGLPNEAKVSAMGFSGNLGEVPLQILALVVAGSFMRYWQALISLTMLNRMLTSIINEMVGETYVEFVLARYDASALWVNLLRPRTIGYESDWSHKGYSLLLPILGLFLITIHAAFVHYALFGIVSDSIAQLGALSILSGLAALGALGAAVFTLIFILGFFFPFPYRQSQGMKEFLAQERNGKEAGIEIE